MRRIKKGQSVMEYVIVLAAIVLGVIAASGRITTGTRTVLTNAAVTLGQARVNLP